MTVDKTYLQLLVLAHKFELFHAEWASVLAIKPALDTFVMIYMTTWQLLRVQILEIISADGIRSTILIKRFGIECDEKSTGIRIRAVEYGVVQGMEPSI